MSDITIEDQSEQLGVRPYTESEWAGAGVVPFGERVLHTATTELDSITDQTKAIADYMVDVMHARHGIGLAGNQVGLSQRLFVHNLPRLAPPVIINPKIVDVAGRWEYFEGCLSMTLDNTHARTFRPQRILVEALSIEGEPLRIAADELLARVFLHEIDHLDGFVYAQRLIDGERDRVYNTMTEAGVDVGAIASCPHEFSHGLGE